MALPRDGRQLTGVFWQTDFFAVRPEAEHGSLVKQINRRMYSMLQFLNSPSLPWDSPITDA